MKRMISRVAPAIALATSLLVPKLALAHALLVDSTPKANEMVHGSSLQVDLKFNSRVDGSRSVVQLASPDGSVRALQLGAQTQPQEIVTHVDGLTKGSYTLRWQALSSDGHITRGQIPFNVGE
jgi:methionine-rich copper-binding protein CopC